MGLFQSYFEGANNQRAYSPSNEDVLEAAGQIRDYIDSEYRGDIEEFTNKFCADDREHLRDKNEIMLLEPV